MLSTPGLYGHVQRNELKSGLLLGGFVLLICLFWFAWCVLYTAIADVWWPQSMTPYPYRKALPPVPGVAEILSAAFTRATDRWFVPLVLSGLWFTAAYFLYRDMIRAATGARPVTRQQQPRLYNLVETLAIAAGLPMPRIEVMASDALNAYAAGLSPDSAVIAVTRGLLEALDDDELEAVLAHEMSHIRNHDMHLMVVATIFAGGLTLVGAGLARTLTDRRSRSPDEDAEPSGDWSSLGKLGQVTRADGGRAILPVLVAIAIAVLLLAATHLLAFLAKLAVSRAREYIADAGAVELTKNADALISALRKISGKDDVDGLNGNLRAMMFSSPAGALLSTHPDVEDRIAALRVHAGGVVGHRDRRSGAQLIGRARDAVAGRLSFTGARGVFGRRTARS